MEHFLLFIGIYLIGLVVYLFFTAIINGYLQVELKIKDFLDAVIWPVSCAFLIGLLIRIMKEIKTNRKK